MNHLRKSHEKFSKLISKEKEVDKPAPKPQWMICKIQVSIGGEPATLIYNKNRSFLDYCPRSFGEKVFKHLGGGSKGYFKCRFNNGEFYVHKRVADKDW